MAEANEIPSFRPSSEWYEDWPFGVDTSVQVEVCVTGAAADRAVAAFLEPLTHDPDDEGAGGARIHYWGGFTVESVPLADGDGWQIVLASAGEGGFDSLESAADALVEALRATPGEVRLAWRELPATRVTSSRKSGDDGKQGCRVKKVGLIGEMSWESSALYYRLLNEGVRDRLGGLHSASCVLGSVDFAEIECMQSAGEWDAAGDLLAAEARSLEKAGADVILLCTNTMHKVASQIEQAIDIPLLHLVDVTAEAIVAAGVSRVLLLGTRFTMEESFYRDRMEANGVRVVVPDARGRATVNRVIYEELVLGELSDESRREFREIIAEGIAHGAEGVILGCTEIELLIDEDDAPVPVFASTSLHAAAAVNFALASLRSE